MSLQKGRKRSGPQQVRFNRQIRAREVRVVGPDNVPIGVMSVEEALEAAKGYDLDLVEVSPTAKPPVCKIIDYGKYKYIEKKRKQEARKKQTIIHVKEVKFRPRTDEHDRAYKIKHLRRFLEEGHKAKVTINFRGREIVYANKGWEIMQEIADALKDVGKIEKMPVREERAITMVLMPIRTHK